MLALTASQLIPVLQTAIGPVILISGVGLLLLSMTNRLGRVIDRARSLVAGLSGPTGSDRERITSQVRVLWKRARLIRLAITLAALSALLAAFLIISLFVTALMEVEWPWLMTGLFLACLISLIASLAGFIHDINLSLAALKVEIAAVHALEKPVRRNQGAGKAG